MPFIRFKVTIEQFVLFINVVCRIIRSDTLKHAPPYAVGILTVLAAARKVDVCSRRSSNAADHKSGYPFIGVIDNGRPQVAGGNLMRIEIFIEGHIARIINAVDDARSQRTATYISESDAAPGRTCNRRKIPSGSAVILYRTVISVFLILKKIYYPFFVRNLESAVRLELYDTVILIDHTPFSVFIQVELSGSSAEIEKEDIRCRIEAVRSQVGRTHPVALFGFDVLVHGFRRIILKAQIHTTHFSCLGIHLVGRSPKLASDHAACIQAPSQAYPRGFLVYLDT